MRENKGVWSCIKEEEAMNDGRGNWKGGGVLLVDFKFLSSSKQI